MNKFISKLTLTLLILCAICTALVAGAYGLTKDTIAARAAADVKALQITGSQAVADEMELKGFHAKTPLMSYLFLC